MLDNYCVTNGLSLLHLEDLEALSSKYEDLLPIYSVRTNNVLAALKGGYESQSAYLDAFIRMSRKEIAELRNCSRKTIKEILSIQSALNLNNEKDEGEYHLYRFIGNRRSACSRNVIPLEEIEEWRALEEKYKEYNIPRPFKRRTKQ